jgi:DNA helicase II / ATP-dependent DNA helicase PcrA
MNRGFSGGGGNAWGGKSAAATKAEKQYGAPPGKTATPSYLAPKPVNKTIEHTPSEDFVASDTSNLQAGQKVEHQKFGFGEVMKMEGAAHNPIATVLFEVNGEKKIMLNYAKLRIVE